MLLKHGAFADVDGGVQVSVQNMRSRVVTARRIP